MAPTKLREKECDVYIYFVPRMEHMTLVFFLNNMTPKLFSIVQIFHGIRSSLGKSLLKKTLDSVHCQMVLIMGMMRTIKI